MTFGAQPPNLLGNGLLQGNLLDAWTAPIADPYRVSSPFGPRGPIAGAPEASRFHFGVDLAHPTPGMGDAFAGIRVVAPNAGRVTEVYDGSGPEGYGVVIQHADGRESHLLHLAGEPLVRVGDAIEQGQQVGAVGSTGVSSGPHLDWRVRENGEWIDPQGLIDEPIHITPHPSHALPENAVSMAAGNPQEANMGPLLGPASSSGSGLGPLVDGPTPALIANATAQEQPARNGLIDGLFNFGEPNLRLLMAGAQMLSNSGPSLTPNRLFDGVPNAIMAGHQMQQGIDQRNALANMNLTPQQQALVDAGFGDQVVAQMLSGPDQSSRIDDLMFLQQNPDLMGPYQQLFGPSPGTSVTVNAGSDTPGGIGVGGTVEDAWTSAYGGAGQAAMLLNQLDTLEALQPQAITGAFAETRTQLANVANTLGLDVDVEGLGASQAVQAIVNQLALSIRDPDGAFGGMPGAVSNRDIQFLLGAVPNLTQTPEGFSMAVNFMRRMANRQQEMANLAMQYYDPATATVNPAFLNAANQLQQQPLFDDEARRQVEALTQVDLGEPGSAANPAPLPPLLASPSPDSQPSPQQEGLLPEPNGTGDPADPTTWPAPPPDSVGVGTIREHSDGSIWYYVDGEWRVLFDG